MNKIFLYIGGLLTLVLASCGSEDVPGVDFVNPSGYFQPAADDESAEASLRRNFFTETGSYLLFNDTLQRVYQGTDINGKPHHFVETIDLSYNIGNSSTTSARYTFVYLTNPVQQQAAVQFVKDYVLPMVSGRMRPYSVFLCNRISILTDQGYAISNYAVANERCLAIAANYLFQRERTETEKRNYANRVLNMLVTQGAQNNSSSFADFYAYSQAYYGVTHASLGINGNAEELRAYGFISSGSTPGAMPTQELDLSAYVTTYMQQTDAQIEARYGRYDMVMRKFETIARVLAELGYVK